MIIDLVKPHISQMEILKNRNRFNIIPCGRRFGKTTLVQTLIAEIIITGLPFGYFTPTYKIQAEVWEEFKRTFEAIIIKKDETNRTARIKGGSLIEFWSLSDSNAGRSRKYKRIIIDEASMIDDLETIWKESIRPTLIDLKGDAYIMGSPSDPTHFFYALYERGLSEKFESYSSFRFPTWRNPYISSQEIEDMKMEYVGDEKRFNKEVGAEFISLNGEKFFSMFSTERNTSNTFYNEKFEHIYLKLDFNAKSTVTIAQHYTFEQAKYYDVFKDKSRGGIINIETLHDELSNLCEYIARKYADKHLIHITGDSSGENITAYNETLFQIINQKLVSYTWLYHKSQAKLDFQIPKRKVPYIVSRQCFNAVVNYYGENYICDIDNCKMLIADFNRCKTSATGGLDKEDMNRNDYGHASDGERYGIEIFETEIILKHGIKI